jgi:integrase
MRTPTEHVATDGTTSWKVRYRLAGRQSSLTFYGSAGKANATKFCKTIDAVGVDRALAYLHETNDAASPTDPTLDQWAERYIRSRTGITDGTRETYTRVYERAWHPTLGHLPLRLVDRERIAAQVNAISATRSDKTVANAHGLLSSMLQVAVYDGHIPANPCKGIRLPRRTAHETVEHRYLTHDEFEQLLAHIPSHHHPLVMLLVGSGIRWGEAEALTVADLDLSGTVPTLRINKAAKWNGSKANRPVGPPKAPKSRRTIALPVQVVDLLRPLVGGRAGNARLFLAPLGGHLRHNTFWDTWKKACEESGLQPHPRIHDLRHTHVAWLVAANIPLPVIQARLGHESITTTIDCYGHLLPDLQTAAAHAASIALEGVRPRLVAV